jgi:hypothetical protein
VRLTDAILHGDAFFLAVAIAVTVATVGIVLARDDPRSTRATVLLAVALGGIAIMLLAVAWMFVVLLTTPSD